MSLVLIKENSFKCKTMMREDDEIEEEEEREEDEVRRKKMMKRYYQYITITTKNLNFVQKVRDLIK